MGCEDAIDIRQPGRLDEQAAFQTVADLQLGLFGVLRLLDNNPAIAMSANFTEEITPSFLAGGQGVPLYDGVLNVSSGAPFNFWTRNYSVINAATRLILAAENITPEAGEQAQFNDIVGQAHATRAWAHFELLTFFSPDLTDDNAIGVPAVDFIPQIDAQPGRDTNGVVFGLIDSDLTTANGLLADQSNPIFMSRDFITALRARMAAYRGDLATAGPLAAGLLASYGLADRTQYENMFLDTDNTEIIYKMERVINDRFDGQGNTGNVNTGNGWAGARFAFVDATLTGGVYFEMGRSLFDRFDPADIRFDVNIDPSSIIAPNYPNTAPLSPAEADQLVIRKYSGDGGGQPLLNDLKVFRSSEMLLLYAISLADAGNFNGATGSTAELIQRLRTARFGAAQPLPVYTSATDAIGAVLDEASVELAFEGLRYPYLKAFGVLGNRGVDRDLEDCNRLGGLCQIAATDFRFTLPIPIIELNANATIRDQQNPGY